MPLDLWSLRIGLVVPVAGAVGFLGANEAGLYAVPLAAGLLLAGSTYGATLLLFGDRILAAAAALTAALNASFLVNSSFVFPDPLATATFTTGFFLLVAGGRAPAGPGWRLLPAAAAAGAGVFFGSTYLVREFSPILLPVVVAGVVLLRYPARRVAVLAVAAVATASLELLHGALAYGLPFVHLQLLLRRTELPPSRRRALRMDHIQEQLDGPLDALLVFPRLALSWRSGWIVLLLLALFLAALVRFRRDRRLLLLGVWCFGFWAILAALALGSDPSGRWIVNVTNARYWYPILPAVAMGAFGGLALLAARAGPRAVRWAAVALAGLAILPGLAEFRSCASHEPRRNDRLGRWHELRAWLGGEDATGYAALVTDRVTLRHAPVFVRSTFGERVWHGALDALPAATPTGHTLVLVHLKYFRRLGDAERRLAELRQEWAPVFVSSDGQMILLARGVPAAVSAGAWWELPPPPAGPESCGASPYE